MNPFSFFTLQLQGVSLLLEAQTVIALRVLGMAGILPASRGENDRMWREKPATFFDAYAAGTRALMAGQNPDQVMSASLAPLSRKVRANRRRLMR